MLAISVFCAITDAIASLKPAVHAAPRRAGDAGGDHARDPRDARAETSDAGLVAAPRRDRRPRRAPRMVTVVAHAQGSTPREAGARMVVRPDGAFTGTIGGGTLEWRAIAVGAGRARRAGAAQSRAAQVVLGPDIGQCCGGQVELALRGFRAEAIATRSPRLREREAAGLFTTAGRHLRRTASCARPARSSAGPAAFLAGGVLIEGFGDDHRRASPFRRRPCRPRAGDGAGAAALRRDLGRPAPRRLPGAYSGQRRRSPARRPGRSLPRRRTASFVLVMTHSHQLDLALVHARSPATAFPMSA